MFIVLQRVLKSLVLSLSLPVLALAQPTQPAVKIALIEAMSGPFANTGEAVYRNLLWAVERVNAGGGVKLADKTVGSPLQLDRFDSKGQTEEA